MRRTMQINIDKKTGIFTGIVIVLLAIIMSMSFSRNDERGFFGMRGFGMMGSDYNQRSSDLSGADMMFLQMMIPHHQQAVDISNLALAKSKDAELLALATDIRDGQSAEIIQMKAWLSNSNTDIDMGRSMGDSMGHSMGGMLTESELAELKDATGSSFDLLWLEGMTNHHDGALHMVGMIDNAKNAEIKRFGKDIATAQTAQIEQMKLMIARLS